MNLHRKQQRLFEIVRLREEKSSFCKIGLGGESSGGDGRD